MKQIEENVMEEAQRSKMEAAFASVAAAGEEEEEVPEEVQEKGIFCDLVFTIAGSVPRDLVSFVIKSLGGRIVWNEKPINSDPSVTITDRLEIGESVNLNRTYVQPQWVFDCLNAKTVLPLDIPSQGSYVPGKELPPHLSPFVGREEVEEGIGDDDREIIAGADDSDDDITEEIRVRAMEAEYAEGIAMEVGEEVETATKEELRENLRKTQRERKEEKARLAAGTLPGKKKRLYDELKEKEELRKNKKSVNEGFDVDDEVLAGEEEEAAE